MKDEDKTQIARAQQEAARAMEAERAADHAAQIEELRTDKPTRPLPPTDEEMARLQEEMERMAAERDSQLRNRGTSTVQVRGVADPQAGELFDQLRRRLVDAKATIRRFRPLAGSLPDDVKRQVVQEVDRLALDLDELRATLVDEEKRGGK